jgi:ABC-type nitrate/sulfonate/bicarbonate transport system substrate-binding protein
VLDGVGPHYMVLGYLASDSWLAAHADVAARFVRAMRAASQWGSAHRAESAALIERIMHVEPSVGATMNRATHGTDLEPALMQPVIDAAQKYGILDRPVQASELIWRALWPRAGASSGRVHARRRRPAPRGSNRPATSSGSLLGSVDMGVDPSPRKARQFVRMEPYV